MPSTPDLSGRPHDLAVERVVSAAPDAAYRAWTEDFDRWFAAPGSVRMRAELDVPFFFQTDFEGALQPHYGRFLRLQPNELVELTWVTSGTGGFETVVTVALSPADDGTLINLSHAGFPNEELRNAHSEAWPHVLTQFDERI